MDYVDGILPLIYGSNASQQGFEYFDGLKPEMIVCDIDGSFTNSIDLPKLPNEQMFIRILNVIYECRFNVCNCLVTQEHQNFDI